MTNLAEHYSKLNSEIRSIMFQVDGISPSELDEVEEFLGVGEYGLALETLSEILWEGNYRLSLPVASAIKALAKSMELHEEQVIGNLVARAERERRTAV